MKKNQNQETVGSLIEKLAVHPFHTSVLTSCRSCQKGTAGAVINVRDYTDQTFGYIELETNIAWINTPVTNEGLLRKYEAVLEDITDRLDDLYSKTPVSVADVLGIRNSIAKIKDELKAKLPIIQKED